MDHRNISTVVSSHNYTSGVLRTSYHALASSSVIQHDSYLPTFSQDLRGRLTLLGERGFIAACRSDLWQAELMDTTSDHLTKVVVKALRQAPTQELIDNLVTNIEACRAAEGDNISLVYGITYVGPLAAIVLPYYWGNINEYLRHVENPNGMQAIRLTKEIVSAVAHLHSHGIVHGNIHSDNFMINKEGHVILTDIGLYIARNTGTYQPIHPRYRWKAPEILLPANTNAVVRPTMAGDMYSLGLTIEELFTLRPPFDDVKDVYSFILMVEDGLLANHVPDSIDMPLAIRNIVRDCCFEAPGARPRAVEVLERLASFE